MEYKDSGVDRNAGYDFVEGLKAKVRKTARPEAPGELGDYGGFFQAPKNMRDPVWVATTDGVGTKLMLAEEIGGAAHASVGQDAVAMCVNDLIACRAEPIIFLDYLATGKLNPQVLPILMDGIVNACLESGCTLVGGETAQMPGYYPADRYDVAGFSVGVLERADRMNPKNVVPGDLVFGIESSGFHSNGFSLVRKVLENEKWKLTQIMEGAPLSKTLLEPTRLYVKPMLEIFKKVQVKGAAHITGGGLVENLPRAIDESAVQICLDKKTIPTPAIMKKFVEAANLKETESFCTWNMGIGFCFIISESEASKVPSNLPFKIHRIGRVEKRSGSNESVYLV